MNDDNQEEGDPQSLTDVVDDLKDQASKDGDLSVQDALDEFAGRLFGPLLVAPALVVVTPVGGIPLVPTIMGLFVVLVAGQSLFGRTHPWLPGVLADRSVDEDKFRDSVEKARPWLEWIDKYTERRLQFLVKGPMKYGIAMVCIIVACTLPPLELLPFACIVPGTAILLLGLAITAQDGLIALVGLIASIGALGAVGYWLLG
ncbi:MAG: exopolysaccharide biosynthesis protein [Planctomycetota bacterium]